MSRSIASRRRAKIVELTGHKDPKVAMAAAVHILDRAFGKPAQSIQSDVRHMDVGQASRELCLQAVSSPPGRHSPTIDETLPTSNEDGIASTLTIDNEANGNDAR
jgi:hypothetical protein